MNKSFTFVILTVLSLLFTNTNCALAAFTQMGAFEAVPSAVKDDQNEDVEIEDALEGCSMQWTSTYNVIKLDCDGTEYNVEITDASLDWYMVYKTNNSYSVSHDLDDSMLQAIATAGDSDIMFSVRVNCEVDDSHTQDDWLDSTRRFFSDLQDCKLSSNKLWCNGPHRDSSDALELCDGLEASAVQSIDYNLAAGSNGLEMTLTLSSSRRLII